jgi:hypothetical protein
MLRILEKAPLAKRSDKKLLRSDKKLLRSDKKLLRSEKGDKILIYIILYDNLLVSVFLRTRI